MNKDRPILILKNGIAAATVARDNEDQAVKRKRALAASNPPGMGGWAGDE